ncbi:hypothetical protein T265_01195 [Opisthorchis viverrini]|uniref:GST N-terminal domain-containing protein n=2 Tax=Opisthorchis viverrini TaxID=6198 RepID=A0A075A0N4_OPIVI|nr:hypothetical protein T265_01195 [Opisthorchis viverrini]KER32921.1 hypothetical protein T265_01195 [Opisthorchis viverrini]
MTHVTPCHRGEGLNIGADTMPTFSKHLRQGDPKPDINPNHYTLFGNRICPFVERVRYTLQYHGIEFDSIHIALDAKPDWFLEISPTGKVPVFLTNDGKTIVESDVIMRFVDKMKGEKTSLLSVCGEEEFQKACELSSELGGSIHSVTSRGHTGKEAEQAILNACLKINSAIKGTYLTGPNLSLADLVMFPFVDRLEIPISVLEGTDSSEVEEFKPNDPKGKQWPVLLDYLLRMRKLPFVAQVRTSAQTKARIAATVRSGHPEWDM